MTTAPDRSAECLEVAARLVAANPGAAEHLLAQHRADRTGRCDGCGQAPPTWPCTLVAIAERARAILAAPPPFRPEMKVVISGSGPAPSRGRPPR